MARPISITGQKFGRLLVLDRVGIYSKCRCDCGRTATVRTDKLKDGTTKSCGCLANEIREQAHKDRLAREKAVRLANPKRTADERRMANVYAAMMQRCYNPKDKGYPRYGGRGIDVCAAWRGDCGQFIRDMAPLYRKGLWLERLDNDLGYSPANCEFRTPWAQSMNRSNSLRFANGGLVARWASKMGYGYGAVYRAYSAILAKKGDLPCQQEVVDRIGPSHIP